MSNAPDQRIESIRSRLTAADAAYSLGSPTLSDTEYDALKLRFRELTGEEWLTKEPVAHRSKVSRTLRMGSLENCVTVGEVRDWVRSKDWNGSTTEITDIAVMPKVDGLACSLVYQDGVLIQASTRGDGFTGEDVTATAKRVPSIPKFLRHTLLPDTEFPGRIEIRGEMALLVKDWKTVDPEEKSNPRNIAAGLVRRDDGKNSEYLTFIAYRIAESTGKLSVQMDLLSKLSFVTVPVSVVPLPVFTGDTAEAVFEQLDAWRKSLPYWTDGAVLSLDNQSLAAELDRDCGVCLNSAFAYKFPSESVEATLLDVITEVGVLGTLTPKAIISPVRIAGTTVRHATLNNYGNITAKGLALGDTVRLKKAGEVIPEIVEVVAEDPDRQPITIPCQCPKCGSPTHFRKNSDGSDSAHLACSNKTCIGRWVAQVMKFSKAHDILDLGESMAEMLAAETQEEPNNHPLLRLYDHTLSQVYFGKQGQKVMAEVKAKATSMTLDKFIGSIGIPHIAAERARQFSAPSSASLEDWLTGKVNCGALTASVDEYIADNLGWIRALAGLIEVLPIPTSRLEICITGALTKKRGDWEKEINASSGYRAVKDVTKTTHILVCNDSSFVSDKMDKAKKYGTQIITEVQLSHILNAKPAQS